MVVRGITAYLEDVLSADLERILVLVLVLVVYLESTVEIWDPSREDSNVTSSSPAVSIVSLAGLLSPSSSPFGMPFGIGWLFVLLMLLAMGVALVVGVPLWGEGEMGRSNPI